MLVLNHVIKDILGRYAQNVIYIIQEVMDLIVNYKGYAFLAQVETLDSLHI